MRIDARHLNAALAVLASAAVLPAFAAAAHHNSRWISATVVVALGSDFQGGLAARGARTRAELGVSATATY